MTRLILLLLLTCFVRPLLYSQEKLEVTRAKAIDLQSEVRHIAVDADNVKWVSTNKGLFTVKAPETGIPVELDSDVASLYQFPGGNTSLNWSATALNKALGGVLNEGNTLSAAAYDSRRDILWIGTSASGAYELKTKPKLTLQSKLNNGSGKSGASAVHTILVDLSGKTWIGTDAGVFYGTPGKWKQEQKYFTIQSIVQSGSDVWVLGDALVWKVSQADKWEPIDLPLSATEGDVTAMAADGEGRLWIASERIARFDPATGELLLFGPADLYTTQFPTCIAVDLDGAVWIGSQDKGMYVIDKASAWRVEIVVQQPLDCNNAADNAALQASVSGGKAPFTFLWNTGKSAQTITQIGPGKYSVVISDAEGNQKKAEVSIQDTRVNAQVNAIQPENAPNTLDGTATATAQGGVSPYTFSWDNGEKTATASKLGAGKHTVTISDTKGCRTVATVDIPRKDAPLSVVLVSNKPVSCAGKKDGLLEINPIGGTKPYKINWSNAPSTGNTLQAIGAGTYPLTITDNKGVAFDTVFVVQAPEPLKAATIIEKATSLNATDGQVSVDITGGTPPYSFAWDNGETGTKATRLGAGAHKVQIKDAAGCLEEVQFNLSENILPLAVQIKLIQAIKCPEEKVGALQVEVAGGKPPFTYSWSNTSLSGDKPTALAAGTYSLTVQDATGNKSNGSFVLKGPDPIQPSVQITAPASTNQSDGQATISATGGTPPYQFTWDTKEEGAKASRLGPGTHQVTITDQNKCQATATFDILENILPLTVSISATKPIACTGKAEGALRASVAGGKAPFQITWNNGSLQGADPSGLRAGNYDVLVKDAAGNQATGSFRLAEPTTLKASVQVDEPASTNQQNGKARVTISGGTPDYQIKWDNQETTSTAVRLAPGKRSVTVTDANGCQTTVQAEITENILPLSLALSESSPIKCAGKAEAALKANVSGGKAPFQFQWSDPALKGDQPAAVKAGTYQITVVDAIGKKASATITVQSPAVLQLQKGAIGGAGSSPDGQATFQVSGGSPAYSYSWDNGEQTLSASRLSKGIHHLTVTDANGCTATASVDIPGRLIQDLVAGKLQNDQIIQLEQIRFDADSTNFNPSSLPYIEELYTFLTTYSSVSVEIGGHTSSLCSDQLCDKLSAARAKSVADYLVRQGIDPIRVSSKGYGKRNPIAPNTTPEGRQKNQRVELKILQAGNP